LQSKPNQGRLREDGETRASGDFDAVRRQLGRPPRGSWRVARRCACGLPQVIETHPRLDDGTPFPTMWWLTCKTLCSEIGRLESTGWMREINELLSWNATMRESVSASIDRFVATRDALAPIDSPGHPGGGPDRVKCVHAHVAHFLVNGDNAVGQAALESLGWSEPLDPCV
jgi:hypothetical protein